MFERFSDEARRAVVLAQEEARLLGHDWIGTEHILLGVLAQGGPVAGALESFGLDLDRARSEVSARTTPPGGTPSGHIPFTPDAKKTLEYSLREALQLGHSTIGTAHLLIGMLRVEDALGTRIVTEVSGDVEEIKRWLAQGAGGPTEEGVPVQRMATRGMAIPMGEPFDQRCAFCDRDLWEVQQSVAGLGAVICADCIDAARTALDEAQARGDSFLEPIRLPPRVFGPVPVNASAEAVAAAVALAFRSSAPIEERALAIEDGEVLAPLLAQTGARFSGRIEAAIKAVRFLTDAHAQVRFDIVLNGGARIPFESDVVLRQGRWQVARETIGTMLARVGVRLPPRSS